MHAVRACLAPPAPAASSCDACVIMASMSLRHPQNPLQCALASASDWPLLIAFSGGLDSSVLLHALSQRPDARARGVRAVHVHHGLHSHADDWAAHCEQVCRQLDVPLMVERVDVPRDAGTGLEAAARSARYEAFERLLIADEVLVTAHHQDDQAETFLLRALRASGPDGLGSMHAWRSFGAHRHWRPLLQVPRERLLEHAQRHRLEWLEDPANADPQHERNFLRLQVMPLLRQRWPHLDAALARSAHLSAEASALLVQEDLVALAMVATVDPRVLSVSALQSLPAPRCARVLRQWVDGLGFPPLPGTGVGRIASDLLPARPDARARFVWSSTVIQRWRDQLHVGRHCEPFEPAWQTQWEGRETLPLPGGGTLTLQGAEALPWPARVHARSGGERLQLPGRNHTHALKHVLQDLGVAPWVRARLPLLSDPGGELHAAGDLAYSASLEQWLRERHARLLWRDAD